MKEFFFVFLKVEKLVAKKEKVMEETKTIATVTKLAKIPFKKQKVEVRDVDYLKGKGVFAMEDISAGEFIAFYPIDSIQKQGTELKPKTQKEYDMIRLYNRYTMTLKNKEMIGVVVNIDDDAWPYLGHRINDGDAILQYTTKEKTPAMVKAYINISKAKENVETFAVGKSDTGLAIIDKRKFVGIAATKDIAKDEELFLHYGPAYWFNFILHNTVE